MAIQTIPAPGAGVTQKVQEFTSTGSFVTPSNVTTVEVFLVGGGGGGGGATNANNVWAAGGGGGGGGVLQKTITVTAGTTYTVTIGAGGAAGTGPSTAGSVGSDTTFGSLATAYGGGAGWTFNDQAGTNTIGTVRATGGSCGWGQNNFGAANFSSSAGGAGGSGTQTLGSISVYPLIGAQASASTLQGGSATPPVDFTASMGGIGINGYGGGSTSGCKYISYSSRATMSINGAGQGAANNATPSNNAGGAGTANTGGGGGGGLVWATPAGSNAVGGAGGSGYARITYWS